MSDEVIKIHRLRYRRDLANAAFFGFGAGAGSYGGLGMAGLYMGLLVFFLVFVWLDYLVWRNKRQMQR